MHKEVENLRLRFWKEATVLVLVAFQNYFLLDDKLAALVKEDLCEILK
jgi:hypothetical protein